MIPLRFLFEHFFEDCMHAEEHQVFGWTVRDLVVASNCAIVFITPEVIPFYNGLPSITSVLFAT